MVRDMGDENEKKDVVPTVVANGGINTPGTEGTVVTPVVTTPVVEKPTEEKPVETTTPTTTVTEPGPQYLEDWANVGIDGIVNNKNEHSMARNIVDYNNWAKANNKDGVDYLLLQSIIGNKDVNKSAEQNAKDEKDRLAEEKWDRIGNALIHLGNFTGTMFGAPDQKPETMTELKGRQKQVADAIDKLRREDKTNFLKAYEQKMKDEAEKEAAAQKQKNFERQQGEKERAARAKEAAEAQERAEEKVRKDAEEKRKDAKEEREEKAATDNHNLTQSQINKNNRSGNERIVAERIKQQEDQKERDEYAKNIRRYPHTVNNILKKRNLSQGGRNAKSPSLEAQKQINAIVREIHSGKSATSQSKPQGGKAKSAQKAYKIDNKGKKQI